MRQTGENMVGHGIASHRPASGHYVEGGTAERWELRKRGLKLRHAEGWEPKELPQKISRAIHHLISFGDTYALCLYIYMPVICQFSRKEPLVDILLFLFEAMGDKS